MIPPTRSYYYGFALLILLSAVANAGGIGGRVIIIPALIFFLEFDMIDAIALCRLTVLGASLITVLLNIP